MHLSSFQHMETLVKQHLDENRRLKIVDIGSYDVNGTYGTLFKGKPNWTYQGVDLEAGPNVDIVLKDPYTIPLASDSVDLIVSGQAFEHVEYFWLSWLEMTRIVKPGGMIFLIAPSRGPEHRHPQDCWRFYPDGYRALAKYGSFELVDVHTDWTPHDDPDSSHWGDTVGVFRKRRETLPARVLRAVLNTAAHMYLRQSALAKS